jgi:uncharacterized protein YbjT (DUF2867 family)
MRAYADVRALVEREIAALALDATVLRPWYVLGPGRRWPLALAPAYALLERLPATRASAQRLGFVSLPEMTAALVWAIENPSRGVRVLSVPEIRLRARAHRSAKTEHGRA